MNTTSVAAATTTTSAPLSSDALLVIVALTAFCCFTFGCYVRFVFVRSARSDNLVALGVSREQQRWAGGGGARHFSVTHRLHAPAESAAGATEYDLESGRAAVADDDDGASTIHQQQHYVGASVADYTDIASLSRHGAEAYAAIASLEDEEYSEGFDAEQISSVSAQLKRDRILGDHEINSRRVVDTMQSMASDPSVLAAIRHALGRRRGSSEAAVKKST